MLCEKLILNLVCREYRDFLRLYLRFWQLGWIHYADRKISSDIKSEKLRLLEKAMRKEYPVRKTILSQIQQYFVRENISLYLLLDLLPAWRYLAQNSESYNEMQLSEILAYASSPLARLIMILNNQDPTSYMPMQSMIVSLLWVMLIEKDLVIYGKIKIPLRQKMSKIKGGLKNASVLMQIVSSKQLKFRTCIFYNSLKMYTIHKHLQFTRLDDIKIILYSTIQFLWVRRRTIKMQKGV